MAKDTKVSNLQTQPETPAEVGDFQEERPQPIYEITREMARVANGASVQDLRELVAGLMPLDKTKAEQYVALLLRLRQAAEAAHQTATEGYGRMANV